MLHVYSPRSREREKDLAQSAFTLPLLLHSPFLYGFCMVQQCATFTLSEPRRPFATAPMQCLPSGRQEIENYKYKFSWQQYNYKTKISKSVQFGNISCKIHFPFMQMLEMSKWCQKVMLSWLQKLHNQEVGNLIFPTTLQTFATFIWFNLLNLYDSIV